MVTITDNQTRTCPDCLQLVPIRAFCSHRGICYRCYAAYMRRYRAAKQSRTIRQFTAQVKRERDARKVQALCGQMFAKFGGVDKFAAAWKANLDAAPRGSRGAFNSYLAILRLVETANTPAPQPDCSLYSDAELQAAMDREAQKAALRLLARLS